MCPIDEFLWGGNGCQVIWQQPDGSFDRHDVDCMDHRDNYSHPGGNTDPGWNWADGFADWLEPGRMALVEWGDNGAPLVMHASLDRGATWERIEIGDPNWGDSLDEIADALLEALGPLG